MTIELLNQMKENLIDFNKLEEIYKKWFISEVCEPEARDYAESLNNYSEDLAIECKSEENFDDISIAYFVVEKNNKTFEYYELSKPVIDEDGDISDYEILGYYVY